MTTHLQNNSYKNGRDEIWPRDILHAKQTLYHWVTPPATYEWPGLSSWDVLADPLTNMPVGVCVFISDSLKGVNPFVARIPRELHEQYMMDCLTECMETKMVETNNNKDDGVILLKYGLIVAFARKTWQRQPSIGCYVQKRRISEARLATIHPNNPRTHRTQKCAQHSCLEKREPTCIHQTMYWITREYLFVYIFASNYYSHISRNWNRGGWVGYGRHCMRYGMIFNVP
jgi:hypothetical protein